MSVESHDLGDVASLAALAGYGDSYVVPGDEVYVVPEDTDYVYRNPGTNPVADGFNIIKAIFLPGYWERRGGSSGGAGLRFNTVALGASGSGRLIDVGLSGLVDGVSTAWVESVKDTWRWDATSTLTADNITVCNPTANGANPGRFIRELNPAPEWLQQTAWFVDTAGNDENDGSTALTPVKTDIEIQRRWGIGVRAQIAQTTTITYAQSPTNQTNYLFALAPGGKVNFVGTPTVSKAGTIITAVQTQVRTPGSELLWAITAVGIGATEVGKVVVITASGTPANVGAYALVMKDEGGGKVRVSPFGTYSNTTGLFTQITPVVGDTVEFRDMSATTLQLGKIEGHNDQSATAQSPATGVTFDSLFLDSVPGAAYQGALLSFGLGFYYARCVGKVLRLGGMSSNMPTQHFWRGAGWASGGNITLHSAGVLSLSQIGSIGASAAPRAGSNLLLSTDCYFQDANVTTGFPGAVIDSSGAAFVDRTTSNSAVSVVAGSTWRQSGAVPDWGTNNTGHGVVVTSTGGYVYATKPTVNGTLGAGREAQIGGTDKLYGAVPFIEPANNAALVATA